MHVTFKLVLNLLLILSSITIQAQIGSVISRRQPKVKIETNNERTEVAELNSQINLLTQNVVGNLKTDTEKSLAIFKWIASNLEYDTELQLDKKLQKKIYTNENNVVKNVLLRKKALCGGYAFLFQQMCASIGIESHVIHGFTKVSGVQQSKKQVHHSWNAVKLNGTWNLLDITWARSHSTNGNPNEFWYATSPTDFIKTHIPENLKWQLLSKSLLY